MNEIADFIIVGLLVAYLIFGAVSYRRGKSMSSCCDVSPESRPRKTKRHPV